jgi:hypothetical protein
MVSAAVIPKDRSQRIREIIKRLFKPHTRHRSLGDRLYRVNRILRGWGNFYRHAWGAKHVFNSLDHYVWWTIARWLKKKHRPTSLKALGKRYGWRKPGGRSLRWRDGEEYLFEASTLTVEHFKLGWLDPPHFAQTSAESPVHNERCTPGSVRGARKPLSAS